MEIKGTKPDKDTPAPVLATVQVPVIVANGEGITALGKVFGKFYGKDPIEAVAGYIATTMAAGALASVRAEYLKATTDEARAAILAAAPTTLPAIPKSGDPVKRMAKRVTAKLASLSPEKLAALLAQLEK
jgi:hypothetical protein